MGKYLPDAIIQKSLDYVKTNVAKICICSTRPTNFAEANSTYMLAQANYSGDNITISDGDSSGRKATFAAATNITVTNDGTAAHVAYISTDELLCVFTCTEKAVEKDDIINIKANHKWEIADPT